MTPVDPEVLVDVRGRLGLLTLNRPRAINALTHGMVSSIASTLDSWRSDEEVQAVAIVGAGDRGLCAGGDVVSLHRAATDRTPEIAAAFWRDEYRMNAAIARYPKPVIVIQDGLVLGGGIGISGHASHRVVTERSRLGFPEVSIGFAPDVGATWLLARAPGAAGIRLGLTGQSVGAADAIHVGFADHFVRSDRITGLLAALETEEPDAVLSRLAEDAGASPLAAEAEWADEAFDRRSVADIMDALSARGSDALAASLAEKSPLALAVTLESLRRATDLGSLEDALVREFRVSMHLLDAPDFVEGVRAQLIEKDRNPQWDPRTSEDVSAQRVASFFGSHPAGELEI